MKSINKTYTNHQGYSNNLYCIHARKKNPPSGGYLTEMFFKSGASTPCPPLLLQT